MLNTTVDATFSNDHTMVLASGLAVTEGQVYYAAGAGPYQACQSIWASLVSKSSKLYSNLWEGYRPLNAAGKMITRWQPLPHMASRHFISQSVEPNVLLVIRPEGCLHYHPNNKEHEGEREKMRIQGRAELKERFYLYLKNHTDAPILREWVQEVWDQAWRESTSPGSTEKPLTMLRCYGDCILGYVANPAADWPGMIASLLRRKRILFPGDTGEEPLPEDVVYAYGWREAIEDGVYIDAHREDLDDATSFYEPRREVAFTPKILEAIEGLMERNYTFQDAWKSIFGAGWNRWARAGKPDRISWQHWIGLDRREFVIAKQHLGLTEDSEWGLVIFTPEED